MIHEIALLIYFLASLPPPLSSVGRSPGSISAISVSMAERFRPCSAGKSTLRRSRGSPAIRSNRPVYPPLKVSSTTPSPSSSFSAVSSLAPEPSARLGGTFSPGRPLLLRHPRLRKRVFGLPFDLYRTFVIERRHGFSTITLRLWVSDLSKASLFPPS